MEDWTQLLGPVEEPVTLTRNGTPLSRYSEGIVRAFVANRADEAVVLHEKTPYTAAVLYEGLRNVAKKMDYRGLVRVHKQDGKVILIRKGGTHDVRL